ncbi:MAG: ABC transporter permease subunit [Actinobacteria bacterium]|nr:ABC transporter permease subunit [Actinomycetota bacterium]
MSAPIATDASTLVLGRPRPGRRIVLTAVLVAAVAASIAAVDVSGGVLHPGGAAALGALLQAAVTPEVSAAFLSRTVLPATALTVAYAVAALTVAVAVGIPGALVASGVLAHRRLWRGVTAGPVRAALGFLRSIDELIWALLFVNVLGLHPLAGVLGIGLPYGATIGRVLAERFQDVPEEPLAALRGAGASEAQVLLYGRLPSALADMTSYVLYRFECAVRAAAVLSFVGLGGVGLELTVLLADLEFRRVWTLLYALVVVIVAVDALGGRLRARLLR